MNSSRLTDARISAREWWTVVLVSVVVTVAAFAPYIYAYMTTPGDLEYLGFVLNTKDQNTYFMWMHQVADGDYFLRNLYTAIPHEGAMFNLYFIVFGAPAKYWGWSLDTCYQLARVISTFMLAICAYALAATFVPRGRGRWLTWFAIVFTAGFGWLTSIIAALTGEVGGPLTAEQMLTKPVDTWVPEAYPWFSMVVMPHFTMALAVLFLTFRWTVMGLLENDFKTTLLAGVTLFALSFVHPYDVIVLYAVAGTGALGMIRFMKTPFKQAAQHLSILFGLGTPPIVYNYIILNENAGMKAWLDQNISDSPNPIAYLLGFGLPLVIAAWWVFQTLKSETTRRGPALFLASWIIVIPILLYFPVAFQRRLAIGLSGPLAVAMMMQLLGKENLSPRGRARFRWAVAIVLVASLSSGFHFVNGFRKVRDHGGENYLPKNVVASLRKIDALERGPGTVLSSFELGNAVPRYTGRVTVIGSRGQTGNFDELLVKVERFYMNQMSAAEVDEFLADQRVEFIVYGPHEKKIGDATETLTHLEGRGWKPFESGSPDVVILKRTTTPADDD